jgi:copper(I)-binding protein
MSMSDGMMKMRELTDGLPIPPEDSVTLEPAADHHVPRPEKAIEEG